MTSWDNIPEEMKQMMFHRATEQGNSPTPESHPWGRTLSAGRKMGAFNWHETPEGHDFWADLMRAARVSAECCEELWEKLKSGNNEYYEIEI